MANVREYKIFYKDYNHPKEDLIAQIDAVNQGWPANAGSLVALHGYSDDNNGLGRGCYFTKSTYFSNEWQCTVLTADEYYWYKLSQATKDKFEAEVRDRIRNRI